MGHVRKGTVDPGRSGCPGPGAEAERRKDKEVAGSRASKVEGSEPRLEVLEVGKNLKTYGLWDHCLDFAS